MHKYNNTDVESHTIMDYQPAQDFCTIVQIEPEIGILQTPKRCGSKELEISTPTKRRRVCLLLISFCILYASLDIL